MVCDSLSSSAIEWNTWLAEAERRSIDVYRLSPERLIAEYRREREITRGYHGREILELLQNAGDAARLAGVRGNVRLEITRHGMVVANTGHPFDTGGVQSLQTANLSPKRQREAVVIGDKGLGFRSILNWSSTPLISSGTLGLAFLPDYAKEIVRSLELENKEVAQWVANERTLAGDFIVPRLAFPKWIPNWNNHEWTEADGVRAVATLCHSLRIDGFDTVIGMPFSSQQARLEALHQVDELKPEFLLLVESIDQLEIHIENREPKVWSCHKAGERWTIRECNQDLCSWTVTSDEGEVPSDLLDLEGHTKSRFKLTLAVPEANKNSPGCLFCFFPTEVAVPLPLLSHATVELDETRKHVNDTGANRHVLGHLAKLIAERAERELTRDCASLWSGCRLVVPQGAWGTELERFGFPALLKEAAKLKKVVPVLSGGHLTAKEAKLAYGNESKWWPSRLFPEMAAVTSKQERKLALALEVESLTIDDVLQRLLSAKDLTLEERANAIFGLIKSGENLSDIKVGTLLCDDSGKALPSETQAILQPTEDLPQLPAWATIRFLHPELKQRLTELLEVKDTREFQQKLRAFGVIEYSLAALIKPVMAEANRQVNNRSEMESTIRGEALQFLFQIFEKVSDTTPFPAEASMRLLNQNGAWVKPIELHLGKGYGQKGNITQDLYASWAKERLIAAPEHVGLDAEPETLSRFLGWLGVTRWPREIEVEKVSPEFLKTVKDGLRYPVDFGDHTFQSPAELSGAWISDAKTLNGLSDILKHAVPEAVLAWLALDPRNPMWSQSDTQHGKMNIYPHYARNMRTYRGAFPSYIYWQVAGFPWLPATDGSKKPPRHCLLGDRQLEALFPGPRQPDEALLEHYGVSGRISDYFVKAGVLPGLAQLGKDEIYRLLLEAPDLSPDGKVSRALCRWLLSHDAELLGLSGKSRERFFTEGRMWGSKDGNAGFLPISEIRHVDFDGLPKSLLAKLPVADLPKRVGAHKVQDVLGIKPIERSDIRQELALHQPSPAHEDQAAWFDTAKPYLKRLRQAQSKQAQAVGLLDRVTLVQCDEIHVRMFYENSIYSHTAQEGEWFLFSDRIYIRGDIDDSIDLLADAAGLAIASLFGTTEGDPFAKILRCDPKSRGKLLKRMCGDDFHEEIEAAHAEQQPAYAGPIRTPTALQPSQNDLGLDDSQPEEANSNAPVDSALGMKSPGLKPLPHIPLPPPARRTLIVRNVQRLTTTHLNPRTIVDGDRCEKIAENFEVQNSPARYALGVGHITGLDAPGFDLVSFNSEDDLESFKNPETRNWEKVLRFIEVKGRSSSTAKIELKGNELYAARKYRDRYFLYRFFEASGGQFQVSILQNPIASQEAKETIIAIDLDRALTTQRFEFVVDDHDNASFCLHQPGVV